MEHRTQNETQARTHNSIEIVCISSFHFIFFAAQLKIVTSCQWTVCVYVPFIYLNFVLQVGWICSLWVQSQMWPVISHRVHVAVKEIEECWKFIFPNSEFFLCVCHTFDISISAWMITKVSAMFRRARTRKQFMCIYFKGNLINVCCSIHLGSAVVFCCVCVCQS